MFKKIITMSLAAIMATSAMAISASAKTVIPLEDGVIMTIYEPGEYIKKARVIEYPFEFKVPQYPTYSFLQYEGPNGLTMDFDMAGYGTEIVLNFDNNNEYETGYQGLYNVSTNKYLTDATGDKLGPEVNIYSTITFSSLYPGHKYRVMLSSNEYGTYARGTATID